MSAGGKKIEAVKEDEEYENDAYEEDFEAQEKPENSSGRKQLTRTQDNPRKFPAF